MAGSPADRYFDLEDELTVALESAERGYVDGSDVGQGEFTIFLGAHDGHALLDSVRQLLPTDLIHMGAHALIRRQDDDELVDERILLAGDEAHHGNQLVSR